MTDHVKNQLCARIEALEAEKLELNEQLDVAQRERDEAARDLAMEQEHHQATRRSEEALAAHVDRWKEWLGRDPEDDAGDWMDEGWAIAKESPTISLARLKAQWQAEEDRLDWLEQQARKSRTGISFDWVPTCEGEPSGFRFMRRHFVGEPAKTLRDAIDRVMRAEGGEE